MVEGTRVSEWKPFFHGAAALELEQLRGPFVFAIDANEPHTETAEEVIFHWKHGRPGLVKMQALLGLKPKHRARDLMRAAVRSGRPPASKTCLAKTHKVGSEWRRFDSIWATDDLGVRDLEVVYNPALSAGSDHALLVADLTL